MAGYRVLFGLRRAPDQLCRRYSRSAKTAQDRKACNLCKIATPATNSIRNFKRRAIGPSGSYLSTSRNKIAPTKPIVNEQSTSEYMCPVSVGKRPSACWVFYFFRLSRDPLASEVLTRRKLADAEAVLRRTKEEAERVTNEAQRAKADAQAARESEAAAKRKLADAEAARTAAEGRCQSDVKSQPGFGARLRKWFRPAGQ